MEHQIGAVLSQNVTNDHEGIEDDIPRTVETKSMEIALLDI